MKNESTRTVKAAIFKALEGAVGAVSVLARGDSVLP